MDFDDLPDSWEVVKLGDIFQFNYGKSLVKSDRSEGQYCVYGSNGVIGSHVEYLVNRPCLIIGRKGSIGEIHYSENPCWPIDTTYYVHEFYDQPVKYWFYQFKYLNLFELDRATAIPGLNRNDSYKIKIPVPPLNEQKRIVEKIDLIQERTRKVKSELDNIKVKLKRLRRSLLASAFRGDLTKDWRADHPDIESATVLLERIKKERIQEYEKQSKQMQHEGKKIPRLPEFQTTNIDINYPKSWISISIESSCLFIIDCLHSTPKFVNEGEYCIDTTCIEPFKIIFEKARKVTTECFNERTSRMLPKQGDILFSREGTIGTTVEVPKDYQICLGQRMMMFRFINNILPQYAEKYLHSMQFVNQYQPLIVGTTSPHLNITEIRKLSFILPPLEEQKEIVRKLEKMMQLADRVEERVKEAETKLDKFNQSVLAKAFRGKLVPQDPNDEPASVLLGKIQQEKNSTTSKKIKK